MEIRTRRLRLVAATAESVSAEVENISLFSDLIGARVPQDWPPETVSDILPLFLQLHNEHPDWTGWLGWYAIRLDLDVPVLCGSVGFKGPPDAGGMVEIGYSVLSAHQRLGFASEMVGRLVQWACAQPGVCFVDAETTFDNQASVRVLEQTGFQVLSSDRRKGFVRYRFGNG